MRDLPLMIKRRYAKGFTLIEIMVAIALLSIGLLGMAGLTVGIMRGNALSSEVTTATALAQAKMEDIKRVGYSAATEITEEYNNIAGYPLFKRDTEIDVDTPDLGMKTVTITVSWNSDASSIAVETILTP
jgi:prepilin-type N-terminal cleavage/methylation domain-containing protein